MKITQFEVPDFGTVIVQRHGPLRGLGLNAMLAREAGPMLDALAPLAPFYPVALKLLDGGAKPAEVLAAIAADVGPATIKSLGDALGTINPERVREIAQELLACTTVIARNDNPASPSHGQLVKRDLCAPGEIDAAFEYNEPALYIVLWRVLMEHARGFKRGNAPDRSASPTPAP